MNDKDALNKALDEKKVFNKMMKYCTYRERAESEVRQQIKKYSPDPLTEESIISKLSEEGFLDNQRFAKMYVSGKFRSNRWGKYKIRDGLRKKKIREYHIDNALSEIDQEEYNNTLEKLIRIKNNSLKEEDPFIRKNKIVRYLINKGFENDLIWEVIEDAFD